MSESKKINQTEVELIKDDLTALDVESFVFYARTDLKLGTGYGNAISMRGGPTIQAELDKMDGAQAGDAVISGGGLLKAKYIIHAVGPMFQEENLEDKLKRTMENVLKAADEKGITQLAFPMMGVGCVYYKNYLAAEFQSRQRTPTSNRRSRHDKKKRNYIFLG
jgi:O-acetyl-ADP-ribose deacetylase (regulator of RNase III)